MNAYETSSITAHEVGAARQLAEQVLLGHRMAYGGRFEVTGHRHECFRYVDHGVVLIFYPHTTSAGNQHVRVRSQNSKDKRRAAEMQDLLMQASPNVMFTVNKVSTVWDRRTRLQALERVA